MRDIRRWIRRDKGGAMNIRIVLITLLIIFAIFAPMVQGQGQELAEALKDIPFLLSCPLIFSISIISCLLGSPAISCISCSLSTLPITLVTMINLNS